MVARYALALSGIDYHSHLLDIHKKREQFESWYLALNPAMTVPTLAVGEQLYTSSSAIVQFAMASQPGVWVESNTTTAMRDEINVLVDQHERFAVERLTLNELIKKLPPLRWLFPKLLRKVCDELTQEIEQGGANVAALQAKLTLNQSRLAYFTGESLVVRQAREVALAQMFVSQFGQAPKGQWLFGEQPSHADVVFIVFLARLRMVGLLERAQVPVTFVDWLEQKTQTSAFLKADVWVKLSAWRLLTSH